MADKEKKKVNLDEEVEKVEETPKTPSKEQEYLELAQRIKAEFENYKRRNADVVSSSFSNGIATTIEKLLPAIDSFNQAKANITDEAMI